MVVYFISLDVRSYGHTPMQISARRRRRPLDARSSFARKVGKLLCGLSLSPAYMVAFLFVLPQVAGAVIRPVRDVQQALASKGFDPGTPDGLWGDKSVAALRAFQKQNGLPETGVIDDGCLRLLLPASPVPPVADTAPTTRPDIVAKPTAKVAVPNSVSPPQPGSRAGIFSAVIFGIGALILLVRRGRRKF